MNAHAETPGLKFLLLGYVKPDAHKRKWIKLACYCCPFASHLPTPPRMAPRRSMPVGSSVIRFDPLPNPYLIPYPSLPGALLPRFRTKKKRGEHPLHISVFDRYEPEGTRGMIWVVGSRPTETIRKGQVIELHTQSRSSGFGRLSLISHMSRHWVTFRITGSRGLCYLRAPIPWVQMSAIECHAHSQHYLSLSLHPLPPTEFCTPLILNSTTSPYEFNDDDPHTPSNTP